MALTPREDCLAKLMDQAVRDAFSEETQESLREAQHAVFQAEAEKASKFVRNLNQSTREYMSTHADIPQVEEVNPAADTGWSWQNVKDNAKTLVETPTGQRIWGVAKTIGGTALFVGSLVIGVRLGVRVADAVVPLRD